MAVDYEISVYRSHLSVTCRGDYDLNDFRGMLDETLKNAKTRKLSKILFDARQVAGKLTTMDFYWLGIMVSELIAEHVPSVFQLAFVGDKSFLDPGRFGETVAKNRGVRGIVTSDLIKARDYLGVSRDAE